MYKPEKDKKTKVNGSKAAGPRQAYVEDVDDDYTGTMTTVDAPPEVPSPPSAVPGFKKPSEPVNVFDFFVGSETPNPSTLNLATAEHLRSIKDGPLSPTTGNAPSVRFKDIEIDDGDTALVQYGTGPVPAAPSYYTPGSKLDRERKKKERDPVKDEKKDKKRKRLHVDTTQEYRSADGDEVMTDAPPVLHSGLTGGLNRLLSRPSVFPPSPDYSGGDAGDNSPASPLKRSRPSRRRESRVDAFSNTIMSVFTTRTSSKELDENRPRKQHRRSRRVSSERPPQKLLEYKPLNGVTETDGSKQMVLHDSNARAELFMSFINKGPESGKGCSLHKALKRYHRERNTLGVGLKRVEEEKELWRSLRLRKNERGEVVVFF